MGGRHAWFHSKLSHTIHHCVPPHKYYYEEAWFQLESSEMGRWLSSQALSKSKSLATQALGLISTLWGDRGTINLQIPEKRKPAVANPTGSPYENQARKRHSTSTRRDIPLFKTTGTITSPARTPKVWVKGPRS